MSRRVTCHYEDTHVIQAHVAALRGKRVVQWSFFGLMVTAVLQGWIVVLSGSAALLSDTIHNFADAATAIPLWFAFALARRPATQRFTYGYGRVEDLVGIVIVLLIAASAGIAGWQSMLHIFQPHPITYLWAVMAAAVIGFLGNEAVALLRIKVGKEIGSAALVADGQHARVDGLTSLSVMGGVIGVWFGYPLADPLIGLLIAGVIASIAWTSGRELVTRLLDGVDPRLVDRIKRGSKDCPGVLDVTDVRVRWLGHRLHAEVNIAVSRDLSVETGHDIATGVRHRLLHQLPHLSNVTLHVDPVNASGEAFHRAGEHVHPDLPLPSP